MQLRTVLISIAASAIMAGTAFPSATIDANAKTTTGTVTAGTLNVRSGAGTDKAIISAIYQGAKVTIKSEKKDKSGQKWYKITSGSGKNKVSGYVSAQYIKKKSTKKTTAATTKKTSAKTASKQKAKTTEKKTAKTTAKTTTKATTKTTAKTTSKTTTKTVSAENTVTKGVIKKVDNTLDSDFEAYLTKQGFPDSYKPMLRKLHKDHPTWIFKAQKTGLKWKDVLNEELVIGRSLVPGYSLNSWKSMEKGAYDLEGGYWYGLDGEWYQASKNVVRYYLDPRNFLDDTYIFMFENLSYNKKVHTLDGVKAILADSFMSDDFTAPDTGEVYSYAQTFMDAAAISGVSPYHLAARCLNEQGYSGAPQSLGTTPGYEGYYNFFDVQAFAAGGLTAQQMGCKYAATTNKTYLLPWTNQYKSIVGGSIFLGSGYITKKQDTLYLQKFDVVDGGNGKYYHQYMTCIFGQANEAAWLKNAYSDEVLASAMEFKIPVYKSMPKALCKKPMSDKMNNNFLSSLKVSGKKISPAFDRYTKSYKLTVGEDVSSVKITAKALDSAAKVSGTGKKTLAVGKNTFKVKVKAQSGETRTYTITITRKGTPAKAVKGDVDGDGKLTKADTTLIVNYLSGKATLTSAQKKLADYNGDNVIDIVDSLAITKKIGG